MEPYEVLETLLGFMETYTPNSELMPRAARMLLSKKLPPIEEIQELVTDIQIELNEITPANQYFGVRNGVIGFWSHHLN